MLNTDFIYLNNFTKIRVNLAVNTLCESVAREMQENEGGNQIYTEIHTSLCNDVWHSLVNTDESIAEIEKKSIKNSCFFNGKLNLNMNS